MLFSVEYKIFNGSLNLCILTSSIAATESEPAGKSAKQGKPPASPAKGMSTYRKAMHSYYLFTNNILTIIIPVHVAMLRISKARKRGEEGAC